MTDILPVKFYSTHDLN